MGGVIFVLGLVTTSRWALSTAARTAATLDPAEHRGPSHDPLTTPIG
jgi:hypothetical protein